MLVVGHYRFICTSLIPPYLGINIHVSIKENNCDKAVLLGFINGRKRHYILQISDIRRDTIAIITFSSENLCEDVIFFYWTMG